MSRPQSSRYIDLKGKKKATPIQTHADYVKKKRSWTEILATLLPSKVLAQGTLSYNGYRESYCLLSTSNSNHNMGIHLHKYYPIQKFEQPEHLHNQSKIASYKHGIQTREQRN